MAQLFDVAIPTINEHLKNIYEQGELGRETTIRKFLTVQTEGQRKSNRRTGQGARRERIREVPHRAGSLFESDFDRVVRQLEREKDDSN